MPESVTSQRTAGEAGVPRYWLVGEVTSEVLRVGLVDADGRLIADQGQRLPEGSPREAVGLLAEMVLALASSQERGQSYLPALGLAVAGSLDPATSRLTLEPSVHSRKGWTRVDLIQLLTDRLAQSGYDLTRPAAIRRGRADRKPPHSLPIHLFPRLHCLAAGEVWAGRARGKSDLVYLSIGEQIHAAILAGGLPLAGAKGQAGSVGWMSLSQVLRAEYQKVGCLTAEAGEASYPRRSLEEWNGQPDSILGGVLAADSTMVDVARIFQAARGGDPLARQVIRGACQWLGRAVANLVVLLDPALILLGGEVGPLLKPFFDEIHTEAERWIPPGMRRGWRLATPQLSAEASLVGAACLLSRRHS